MTETSVTLAAAQQGADGDVVLHVAGQPVDLVDHDGVDVAVLGDAGQHLLELRPVGASGRLAAVDVLVDQVPALVPDVADAGLALGGDGEAFLAVAVLGLLAGSRPAGRSRNASVASFANRSIRPPSARRARPSARTSVARVRSARA